MSSYCTLWVLWQFFFLSYYLDRRDSLKRAANISLVDVAEADEGEIREMVRT